MSESLVFRGPWDIGLESRPAVGPPGPTEVVVEIRATGICGTDVGIVSGAYAARAGVVLGHESAGCVIETGCDVVGLPVGARVAIDPTYHCGLCRMCRTDRPNHCEQKAEREAGVVIDGTFGRFFRTDARFIHRIADHVTFEAATMAEPLSCVLTGLKQLRLRGDLDCAVVGAGPIGMLYSYALAAQGLVGTIIEASPGRRGLAAAVAPAGWRIASPEDMPSDPLDLVVDCSGQALDWALATLRRGGQFCAVGLTSGVSQIHPATLADRSLSIIGSIDSIGTFGLAVRMIETSAIPVARLVTDRVPLADYRRGFALVGLDLDARRRVLDDIQAIKVLLTC